MNLNYTYLETEGNYGGAIQTTQVAGFVPRTGNVALSYRGKRLNAVAQWNWRARYLSSVSTNAALFRYENPRSSFDLKTKYTISPRLGLFCDIENLTSEPLYDSYYVYRDRINTLRLTVPKITAGLQGRF